jgi:hypothetical protein
MAETPAETPSAVKCTHPGLEGKRWGDPISEERQAELQAILDAWDAESDHGKHTGPFDWRGFNSLERRRRVLSGADAYWLAEHVRNKFGEVSDLHLEGAFLFGAHLEGADFRAAHLETLYVNPIG